MQIAKQQAQTLSWNFIHLAHDAIYLDLSCHGMYMSHDNTSAGLIANTMNAHRLLELALGDIGPKESLTEEQLVKRQNAVVDALYKVDYSQSAKLRHYRSTGNCYIEDMRPATYVLKR